MSRRPIKANALRVVVPVQDYGASVEFYGELLQAQGKPVSAGRTYFDLGGVTLCVYHAESDGDEAAGPLSTPVYLTVRDVEEARANAEWADASEITPIVERPWGERSFYCTDPAGNRLCFIEDGTTFRGEFYVD